MVQEVRFSTAGDLPQALMALPVLLESATATMVDGPRSGTPIQAYELTFKAVVSPEDLVVVAGALSGHKLTVTLRVDPALQGVAVQ